MCSRLANITFSTFLFSNGRQCCQQPQSLFRCSLSTQSQQQEENTPFMTHYLISSFSFPADEALKVSSHENFVGIETSEQPDSVVSFLTEIGLSDSQIKNLILSEPDLLSKDVNKILRSRVQVLMDAGFTAEIVSELIQSNPQCLDWEYTLSRLLFWRNFIGDSDKLLLKVLRRNRLLISLDIDKHVFPRLNLLHEFGFSNQHITNLLVWGQDCFFLSLESLRQILQQTEELGFSRKSPMFVHGLRMVGKSGKDALERKAEFFKNTYGWSDKEISSTFRKFPYILGYSEEKVKRTMEFLIETAKLDTKTIASHAVLLGLSLEKRLMPRYQVISTLQSKGLKKKCSLCTAFIISEVYFVQKFLVAHEKDMPELAKAYAAAKSGEVRDLEEVICTNLQ